MQISRRVARPVESGDSVCDLRQRLQHSGLVVREHHTHETSVRPDCCSIENRPNVRASGETPVCSLTVLLITMI